MLFLTVTLFVVPFTRSAVCSVIQPLDAPNELPEEKSDVPMQSEVPMQEDFSDLLPKIVPGTKWCGDGNISSNYEDLGRFRSLDACCREHDFCDDIMPAGTSKYNLANPDKYTKLHCKCDQIFFECLKKNSLETDFISHLAGKGYFTYLGNDKCYKEEYPIIRCKTSQVGLALPLQIKVRCSEYELDETRDKIWQWFDTPLYNAHDF